MRKIAILLVALALAAHAWLGGTLAFSISPPWPDEALFCQPAKLLVERGTPAMPLLAGALAGVEERSYFQPPGYFLFMAPLFAVFGFSIEVAKAGSVLCALVVLLLTYAGIRRLGAALPGAIAALAAISVDRVFLRASVTARMEMACLGCILASLLILFGDERGEGAPARMALGGFFAGLSLLFHLLAAPVVAVLVIHVACVSGSRTRWRAPAFFSAPIAVLLAAWAAYAACDFPAFFSQFGSQLIAKTRKTTGWMHLLKAAASYFNQFGPLRDVNFVWMTSALAAGAIAHFRRGASETARLAAAAGLVVLAAGVTGREIWYPVYAVPFAYMALAGLLCRRAGFPRRQAVFAVIAACLFVMNAASLAFAPGGEALTRERYYAFCRRAAGEMPAGSCVLLACVPDPWFGLVREDRKYVLQQFVPEALPFNDRKYSEKLWRTDFVLTTNPALLAGNFYTEFLSVRARSARAIEGGGITATLIDVRNPDESFR